MADDGTAREPDEPVPIDAATALERLGALSMRDLSMEALLQAVADLTRSVLPGRLETSVCLLIRDRPTTVVYSGQLAMDLDERQYEHDRGPCLHAARSGAVVEIPDTATEERWPEYAARAAAAGNGSSLSIPLVIPGEGQLTGALNIYARAPHTFDDAGRAVALRFGPYAAVAAGNLYAYRTAMDDAENMRVALRTRAVIDQAKGIIMERHKVTADQAFQLLARESMNTNQKVQAIAERIVRTGEMSSR
jgi:GAF domain-containing protein